MASNNPQPNRNHFWTVGILVAVVAGLCGVIALLLLRGGSEAQKEKEASPVAAPREDAYLNELRADLEYLRNNMQAYLENAAELESDPAAADGRTEASGEKDDADADLAAAQKRLDDAKAQYNAIYIVVNELRQPFKIGTFPIKRLVFICPQNTISSILKIFSHYILTRGLFSGIFLYTSHI